MHRNTALSGDKFYFPKYLSLSYPLKLHFIFIFMFNPLCLLPSLSSPLYLYSPSSYCLWLHLYICPFLFVLLSFLPLSLQLWLIATAYCPWQRTTHPFIPPVHTYSVPSMWQSWCQMPDVPSNNFCFLGGSHLVGKLYLYNYSNLSAYSHSTILLHIAKGFPLALLPKGWSSAFSESLIKIQSVTPSTESESAF